MDRVVTRPEGEQSSLSPERELGGFLVATFVMSWGLGMGAAVLVSPDAFLIGVFGPAIAALWVTKRYEGNVSSLWTHVVRWRIRFRWYAAAAAIPLAVVPLSYAIVWAAGGTWEVDEPLSPVFVPLFFVFAFFIAGGPEELGWRGYALPRLQSRWNALTASVVLGIIWALWHLPLWFLPDLFFSDLSYPLYAVSNIAMCIVFTWVYNSSGGSILLAMLMHASVNVAAGFLPTDAGPQAVSTGIWVAVAMLVVVRYGARDLSASPRVDRAAVRSTAPPHRPQ